MEESIQLQRLQNHYKHCIRLNASNKINPKNAFDLQLIDFMQDLVNDPVNGQMNFKIASSALDVGAKIYSNRVDCIHSEAQKVAGSILMALDGKQAQETDEGDDHDISAVQNDSSCGDEQAKVSKKKKPNRKKNIKTVVNDSDTTTLDAELEQRDLPDPYLDGLTRDYDISSPMTLICYNALTQPNGLLTIDNAYFRKNFMKTLANELEPVKVSEGESPDTANASKESSKETFRSVTLITKHLNLGQILRDNQQNQMFPRLEGFLFNDRTTTIAGFNSNFDDSIALSNNEPQLQTTHIKLTGGDREFNPDYYDGGADDCVDDHFGDSGSIDGDGPIAEDLLPNLDKVVISELDDYGLTKNHRLLNTWAGPQNWKPVKGVQAGKKDGPPKSTRKRIKLEQEAADFSKGVDQKRTILAKDKEIRHGSESIKRWKKPLLPQDHNLTEETIMTELKTSFINPADTYHCEKTPSVMAQLVGADHAYDGPGGYRGNEGSTPMSPGGLGGFDDVHDDSDDEFRADPIGAEAAIYGSTQHNDSQADLEFAGEHLIEQPYTVAQINIPFAKTAKKMDVRKLKRVMWDLLNPPEKRLDATQQANVETEISSNDTVDKDATVIEVNGTKKTPSPTPSELVHLEFSNLYSDLPMKVSTKMANDLSQPIAFVTLLHLANEKNLKLIPKQDLNDFIIEQDGD